MHRLSPKTNDAGKLLAFATLFFGKEKRAQAEELVGSVLSLALEDNAGSPMPAGIERTLKLFHDAHNVLERGYLQRPKKMSRAALREACQDITGLLVLPGAQRETVILTKCIGFSYKDTVKITVARLARFAVG